MNKAYRKIKFGQWHQATLSVDNKIQIIDDAIVSITRGAVRGICNCIPDIPNIKDKFPEIFEMINKEGQRRKSILGIEEPFGVEFWILLPGECTQTRRLELLRQLRAQLLYPINDLESNKLANCLAIDKEIRKLCGSKTVAQHVEDVLKCSKNLRANTILYQQVVLINLRAGLGEELNLYSKQILLDYAIHRLTRDYIRFICQAIPDNVCGNLKVAFPELYHLITEEGVRRNSMFTIEHPWVFELGETPREKTQFRVSKLEELQTKLDGELTLDAKIAAIDLIMTLLKSGEFSYICRAYSRDIYEASQEFPELYEFIILEGLKLDIGAGAELSIPWYFPAGTTREQKVAFKLSKLMELKQELSATVRKV